uniref:Uncharacterized protein n=1 Tax=Arundo donax TaxID=35708 RepID=A0A0A9BEH2_ARUDO
MVSHLFLFQHSTVISNQKCYHTNICSACLHQPPLMLSRDPDPSWTNKHCKSKEKSTMIHYNCYCLMYSVMLVPYLSISNLIFYLSILVQDQTKHNQTRI